MRRVILLFKFKFIDFAVHATPTCRTDLITCLTFFLLLPEPESFFLCWGLLLGFSVLFSASIGFDGKIPQKRWQNDNQECGYGLPGAFLGRHRKKASGLVDPIDLFRSTFRPGDFGQIFASPSEMFSDTFLDLI